MRQTILSLLRRCSTSVLLISLLASCRETEPGTAIIVEVRSDLAFPEQMDSVRIDLIGREKQHITMSLNIYALPLRVAVVPDVNKDDTFTVVATGLFGKSEVVNQSARLRFLPGQSRVLTLMLGRDCVGKECNNASLTCSRGRCESNERDSKTLPVFAPTLDGSAPDSSSSEADAAPPADVMGCFLGEGQTCGSCGGTIRCDGTCSVATPATFGQGCGECNGTVQCDGSCTNALTGAGQACGTCGALQCNGMCEESKPSNLGQSCGSCGGKTGCSGTCSVATPATFGQPCGTCGTLQCDGMCKEARPANLGQMCGTCGTLQCDGACLEQRPANHGQACGACGGTIQCNGACTAFPAQGCCKFASSAEAVVFSRPDSVDKPLPNPAAIMAMTWTWSGVEGIYRSLLNFDLASIPANSTPLASRLRLFSMPPPGQGHSSLTGANDFELRRNLQAWTPAAVTWTSQPSQSMDVVKVGGTTEVKLNYRVDVTRLLGPMIQMPANNFGMSMRLTTEVQHRSVVFASSGHADPAVHPRLEIEFTPGACGF